MPDLPDQFALYLIIAAGGLFIAAQAVYGWTKTRELRRWAADLEAQQRWEDAHRAEIDAAMRNLDGD